MNNRMFSWVVFALILLAGVGLVSYATTNPLGLLKQIVIYILIGCVIYYLFRRFSQAKPERKDARAFQKAARTSKKRFKDTSKTTHSVTANKKGLRTKKKSSSHLTVIEGKKGKKKNRAFF